MWTSLILVAAAGVSGFHVTVAPGERLWVEVGGTGQPVVLVPGLFGAAFGYRNIVPLLHGHGYRTVVVEPLGTGRSTRPHGADYSFASQARRLAAVVDSLGEGDVLLVAHSIGAAMAFRLAAERPDLVRGILSLEGGAAEGILTPSFRRALRLAPLLKVFGGRGRVRRELMSALVQASGDGSWVTEDVVDGYVAPALEDLDGTIRTYRAMAEAREPRPLLDQLGEVRAPVLLLLGTAQSESRLPPAEVALLTARLPALVVDTVPGAGHYVHEERPTEVVAAVVRLNRITSRPVGRCGLTVTGRRQTCVRS